MKGVTGRDEVRDEARRGVTRVREVTRCSSAKPRWQKLQQDQEGEPVMCLVNKPELPECFSSRLACRHKTFQNQDKTPWSHAA